MEEKPANFEDTLSDEARESLAIIGHKLANGENWEDSWESLVPMVFTEEYFTEYPTSISQDINAIVYEVLKESYLDTTEDLKHYAEKVKYYNRAKKRIREYADRMRDDLKEMHNASNSLHKKLKKVEKSTKRLRRDWKHHLSVVSDFENYIQEYEEKLSTIGDDAQLANIDLQNSVQKLTQTMQMMSTISKQMHDTAMGIIRNIK